MASDRPLEPLGIKWSEHTIDQMNRIEVAQRRAGIQLVGHNPRRGEMTFATRDGIAIVRHEGRYPELDDFLFAGQFLCLRSGVDPDLIDMQALSPVEKESLPYGQTTTTTNPGETHP
jgi:hypothetical protein